ncbi:MAG: NADH-quinone oxidoreductase subunit B family protein [Planctomycetota bacterium]|jgi:Ni,Fe-hydrogenase III small subunit
MSLTLAALKKSIGVYHVNAGACNNCDIEVVELLTPRFDVERLGITLAESPRHADALLVSGIVTRQVAPRVQEVYRATPKPCVVFALGACTNTRGIFSGGYNAPRPLDEVIREVDPNAIIAYVPGCPPKPEAMVLGVVKALAAL